MKNKSNIRKYKFLSKFYDKVFSRLLDKGRVRAFSLMSFREQARILLIGVGTGLDVPLIPETCNVVGVDLSSDMLEVAKKKYSDRNIEFIVMNAEELEFNDNEFDVVIISLVLSVVESPAEALQEALRVMKMDGKLLIYDKFSEQKVNFWRKLINVITSAVGTDITRSFYDITDGFEINIHQDIPVMYAGNYRAILISK